MRGFSLVELGVVLIVIGIIVAGVLIGKDMVASAKVRATISQIEEYNTGFNVFIEKYDSLPGDFIDAQLYLGATLNGDGDGNIFEANGPPDALPTQLDEHEVGENNELVGVWQHMGLAGVISRTYTGDGSLVLPDVNIPQPKIGDGGMIIYSDSTDGFNKLYIGIAENLANGNLNPVDALTPIQAFSIDTKIDDGFSDIGLVTGSLEMVAGGNAYTLTPINDCAITIGGEQYNLGAEEILCQLIIRVN